MQISNLTLLAILATGCVFVIANASLKGFRAIRIKPANDNRRSTKYQWEKASNEQAQTQQNFKDQQRSVTCLYCQILVSIALCFISVLANGNLQFLLISTSFGCFIFVSLNLTFVMVPKSF